MIKICTYMWYKNAKKEQTQIYLKINWLLFSQPVNKR